MKLILLWYLIQCVEVVQYFSLSAIFINSTAKVEEGTKKEISEMYDAEHDTF